MTVHYACSDELQKQIQRILELIVDPSGTNGSVHRSRQWRMNVRIHEESSGIVSTISHATEVKTHPLSSRNLQMTLATASSFLSKPAGFLALVLAASFSDAVAPKHKAKSIVED